MKDNFDYKEDLKKRLSELKEIDGFPIGEDEDILALSEPPYYTACPNPYINEFIEKHGKPYNEETDTYHREPFVGDVSEGKNDPIYNAHSYHTKVPHKAIMKYIEHYTDEGDIVLDGFCGTGMTGVAAQLLNRKAILSDLSPIATFIAYNYNNPVDVLEFKREANRILDEVEKEYGWMYETIHYEKGEPKPTKGRINYVVWSDVFICPYCNQEYVYWDLAIDFDKEQELKSYFCSQCNSQITKRESNRAFVTHRDIDLNQEFNLYKTIPVLIKYTWKGAKFEKTPDDFDFELIKKIDDYLIPNWYPTDSFEKGDKTNEFIRLGIKKIHQLYTKRNLCFLSKIHYASEKLNKKYLKTLITSIANRNIYKGNRFVVNNHNPKGRINGPKSGTYYIPSVTVEQNGVELLSYKLNTLSNLFSIHKKGNCFIQTQSVSELKHINNNSIDYIFTDPPFGHNIMYSELNLINECWIKVKTNNYKEAVVSKIQNKDLASYNDLMLLSFREYYRVLKPNRWITVEFHNTKSVVWNGIQEAMVKSGFIVANVSILDKQSGTINQSYIAGAASKDLVISAYKPAKSFEERIMKNAGKDFEQEFVKDFLSNLPKRPLIERTEQMLYSKMLAYYIQRGYEVHQNASTFYQMLRNNFTEEDGFWFLPTQITDYHDFKKEMKLKGEESTSGMLTLFITDEKSAIIWLNNFLNEAKSYSDIHSAFTKLLNKQDDEMPELSDILKENFVEEDGKYRRPTTEEEKLGIIQRREKLLLRDFESLILQTQNTKKKLKNIRKEAVIHGLKVYNDQKRYREMVDFGKRLHTKILENNPELSMLIEVAELEIEEFD